MICELYLNKVVVVVVLKRVTFGTGHRTGVLGRETEP